MRLVEGKVIEASNIIESDYQQARCFKRNFKEGFQYIKSTHMKWFSRGKNEDNTDRTFNCKHCNMKFEDEEKMKRHARKAHSEKGGDMPNFNPFGGT